MKVTVGGSYLSVTSTRDLAICSGLEARRMVYLSSFYTEGIFLILMEEDIYKDESSLGTLTPGRGFICVSFRSI
jgi:hypothetical protein